MSRLSDQPTFGSSSSQSSALGSRSVHSSGGRSSSTQMRPPADACLLVLGFFFMHGIGVLLPWNIFINAKDYFQDYKLNTTESRYADYRVNFMNYVGLAAQLPNTIMSGVNVFFQPIRSPEKGSTGFGRIAGCIVMEILVCLATIVLSFVDTSDRPEVFFGLTIVSVVVINCCVGVYQSAAFGLAAILPMRYSNALVVGSNACGTIIAVVNIVSKAASTKNLQQAAVYYFSFAIASQIACLATLLYLPRLEFYRFHVLQRASGDSNADSRERRARQRQLLSVQVDGGEAAVDEDEEMLRRLLDDRRDDIDDTRRLLDANGDSDWRSVERGRAYSCQLSEAVHVERPSSCFESAATVRQCCGLCCFPSGKGAAVCSRYWRRYWLAFRGCWTHCLSVWCVFFCTLSCFPAIQASVEPADPANPLLPRFWFTDVLVFLLFNLCAMVGNLTSDVVQWPRPNQLAAVVWLRALLFIPFFLACNFFPDNRPSGFPVLIANDWIFAVGMALFALSSGHLSSLCMMYAPRQLDNPSLADLAAMICAFCLVLGVVSGVAFGSLLFKIMYVR